MNHQLEVYFDSVVSFYIHSDRKMREYIQRIMK